MKTRILILALAIPFMAMAITKQDSLNEQGLKFLNEGQYPKAIESLLAALNLYEQADDDYGTLLCRSRLVDAYCSQGDFNTALRYIREAKRGVADEIIYTQLGFIYAQSGNPDTSLFYFQKSIAIFRKIGKLKSVAINLNDIGNIYEKKEMHDSALVYYSQSLKLAGEIKDTMAVANALGSIGDLYFSMKDYKKALEYEYKCLETSRSISFIYSMRETEKVISDIYAALNDPINSLKHYKLYTDLKDSLLNEENIKQIVRIEDSFKFEKEKELARADQDKKDALHQEELKHQKNLKIFFILGFSIVVVFSVFLFRSFKKTQRQRNVISEQKKLVEEKKKEMTDNINYAQRIQQAILPSAEYIKANFPENFIIYKPKDIVSGDFYWSYRDGDSLYFAAADCTGHGVSGAMMSMIGTQLLNEIVIERKITRPDLVLNELRSLVIKAVNPEGAAEERKDGMDISFCRIFNNEKLQCASANNSVFIVRKGEVLEIKADRMPVGKYADKEMTPFTLEEVFLEKGDIIYALSDGFCDQFGGEKGKKLMTKRFKEWVTELAKIYQWPRSMATMKDSLEARFVDWVGSGEQIDDVCVMAVRI